MSSVGPTLLSSKFLFLCASARRAGNSELLARRAAQSLPTEVSQHWISLADHPLPVFEDFRHATSEAWVPVIAPQARVLLDATLAATDLVLVVPLYWYSIPSAAKLYLDHWTAWLRVPGVEFKSRMAGKALWAVTALSDHDARLAAPLGESLKLTAEYMRMRWGGHLLGYGNRPGDLLLDAETCSAAAGFFANRPSSPVS